MTRCVRRAFLLGEGPNGRNEGDGDDPFSQAGDSGSLVVNADRKAVALLFAGGDLGGSNCKGLTYANPINAVLRAMKVELLFS